MRLITSGSLGLGLDLKNLVLFTSMSCAQVWHVSQGISQSYLHTHTFIRNRNEPYLHLPSQL